MRHAAIVAALAALMLGGCKHDPVSPMGQSDLLSVSASRGQVTLVNRTAAVVAYRLATPTFLALADPAPCPTAAPCDPTVPAHGRVVVPYANISGYAAGEHDAVVLHWLAPVPGSSELTAIRRIEIRLR